MTPTETRHDSSTTAARSSRRALPVFFGHHKCATGWIDGILRETCFHLGWRFFIAARAVEIAPYGDLGRLVDKERVDLLAYTNADATYIDALPAFRGFHLVRDPRDVVVSGYFSHLHSHSTDKWPELLLHRERLQACSKEEGLMLEMAFSRQFLDPMRRWDYDHPDILELKLETLSADPEAGFTEIFRFLGLLDETPVDLATRRQQHRWMTLNTWNQRGRRFTPFGLPLSPFRRPMPGVDPERLALILERKSFKKMAGGRKAGQENVKSHYRKGKAGDWQNHFTERHREAFKEQYGDLLIQLGYEDDYSW